MTALVTTASEIQAACPHLELPGFEMIAAIADGRCPPPWDRFIHVYAAPSDGICDDVGELNRRMQALAASLDHDGSVDTGSASAWGKLYFDRVGINNWQTRILLKVFPDPEVALGVAKATARKPDSVWVPDEVLYHVYQKLDKAAYHEFRRDRSLCRREDGTVILYPGGRFIKICHPPRPTPTHTRHGEGW